MFINFSRYSKIFVNISFVLMALSIFSILFFGLNFGIEFTGGSSLEIKPIKLQENQISKDNLQKTLEELGLKEFYINETNNGTFIIKTKFLDQQEYQDILNYINKKWQVQEVSLDNIGPVISEELKQKSVIAIVVSLVAMFIYIAMAFRQLKYPVPSFKYSLITILTLIHDIIIPLGFLAFISQHQDVQITIPIITAFLIILGYCINDTIIIFDRVRENLLKEGNLSFSNTLDKALNQVLLRSLTTSLTTIAAVASLYVFGPESLKLFSLVLIVGISVGTYSSIFFAASLVNLLGKNK
ncbi:hypothetical protein HRbin34_00252 [bacterium HR34]|nr:hypothetical protein HRbin34_00252 [bacterium HR34]